MPQGFDKTKPEFQAGVSSEVLRTQFNALCSHHEGIAEPLDVQRGQLWLDTSVPDNWKLKLRRDSDWIVIMEHVNGVLQPPSVPGGGAQIEFVQAAAVNPWNVTHNIGKRVVPVIVVDGTYKRMDPSSFEVEYVDVNSLTITFVTGPTSGTAYIN